LWGERNIYRSRTPRFTRRRRRRSPAPAIVLAVILLLLGCWVFNLTCGRKKEKPPNLALEYLNRARPLAEATAAQATTWSQFLSRLGELATSREELDSRLRELEEQCRELWERSREIEPPPELERAHASLTMCLEYRYRAVQRIRPDLVNAVEAQELSAYAPGVTDNLRLLVFSDGFYRYFREEVTEKVKGIEGMERQDLPEAAWIGDWSLATPSGVDSILKAFRRGELRGVAITQVALDPAGKSDASGVLRLPRTGSLTVTVSVENQGGRVERDLVVSVKLYSDARTSPARQEQSISQIAQGSTVKVTFKGLKPATGGVRNVLEVSVSTVPGEAVVDNNRKTLYFVVE